jgi:hypothetical protein
MPDGAGARISEDVVGPAVIGLSLLQPDARLSGE